MKKHWKLIEMDRNGLEKDQIYKHVSLKDRRVLALFFFFVVIFSKVFF